jgi:hypothetical protein
MGARFFGLNSTMALPTTGTAALLDLLSAFVPDDELFEALPRHRGSGRLTDWSPAQLFRVLLLLLLTPARSTNLLCQLLPEHRAWRRFAHLPNRCRLPSPRQLHEFRLRLTPGVLRSINEHLPPHRPCTPMGRTRPSLRKTPTRFEALLPQLPPTNPDILYSN